jgi:hypothetical protein
MMVLRLTNSAISGPKPKLFVAGAIHSSEYAIAELVTLAWAVVGLCLSKSANLSSWGEAVESRATQVASPTRRLPTLIRVIRFRRTDEWLRQHVVNRREGEHQ